MRSQEIADYISGWLNEYCEKAGMNGFVIGISGGIDSALTSTLCALTGKEVYVVNMPIRQKSNEVDRAHNHIETLKKRFSNVTDSTIDLTAIFEQMEATYPAEVSANELAMANTRARLRMTTLYALAQAKNCLVAGTGNKVEDFGVGFFTKYGDGGVDLSPIADLTKTDVRILAAHLGVITEIIEAPPTDGLWGDARSDEEQIGATYPELEWAMDFSGDESELSERQQVVLGIFRRLNTANKHKMEPIPVCEIPKEFR